MVQIELHEGKVVKNTSTHNGMQKGSVRFTSKESEVSPTNPNARNLVTRSCVWFGDTEALIMDLEALGLIDSAGNIIQENLNDFCIVKTRSYIPRDKNHEPVFCPYEDHPQFNQLMEDSRGSNYFHSTELMYKFNEVEGKLVPQPKFIDLTPEQEVIKLDITDYPRLVELQQEIANKQSDQES